MQRASADCETVAAVLHQVERVQVFLSLASVPCSNSVASTMVASRRHVEIDFACTRDLYHGVMNFKKKETCE